MMEWVDCLKNKLRDISVLAPRDNIYSAPPVPKAPLPPSRNPLSPLPPCPNGGVAVPPGVEIAGDARAVNEER
jgi:hypothetical protein